MTFDEKQRLTRQGDIGKEASGVRIRAARLAIGKSQAELGKAADVKKAAISNVEQGLSLPNRELMRYLYREHRIDFNFLMHGDFNHLHQDVQDSLFFQLERLENGPDQISN
ncbi:hypothetical protein JI58_06345 [Marinosulfonomonas sp. PRT-SC04]|nr:hypothetical protein JI58_06345 [Marinosulfonomonas sp. PRT-SC04]